MSNYGEEILKRKIREDRAAKWGTCADILAFISIGIGIVYGVFCFTFWMGWALADVPISDILHHFKRVSTLLVLIVPTGITSLFMYNYAAHIKQGSDND